jgi:hypothetical protein
VAWGTAKTKICLNAFSLLLKGQCDEITGGKFAACVVETGGKLPPDIVDIVSKLLPVSTTPAVPLAEFAAGVVDAGGISATGVKANFFARHCTIDTGGAPSLANISTNFPKISNSP